MKFNPSLFATISVFSVCLAELAAAELKVSSVGFHREDSTAFIQKALDSGAQKVILDDTGAPWNSGPLFLRSNQELTIAPGVTLQAAQGAFLAPNDCLLNLRQVQNVVVSGGENSRIVMRKSDYTNRKQYPFSEWRHAVSIQSSKDIAVRNLTIRSSGGDGIYIGSTGRSGPSVDVTVSDCLIDDHYRQGISVINVDGLTIRDSVIRNTRGTPPEAGIDFEPNVKSERLTRCLLENVTLENNRFSGINFSVNSATPIDVAIRNCRIIPAPGATGLSFCIIRPNTAASGQVLIDGLAIDRAGKSAVMFQNFRADGNYTVNFRNLTIQGTPAVTAMDAPFLFKGGMHGIRELGSAAFGDVTVTGYERSRPIVLDGWSAGMKLRNLSGQIRFNGATVPLPQLLAEPELATPEYQTQSAPRNSFRPPEGARVVRPSAAFRSPVELVIDATQGELVEFELEHYMLSLLYARPGVWNYALTAPGGQTIALEPYTDPGKVRSSKKSYRFIAPETGLYTLPLESRPSFATAFHPGATCRWALRPGAAAEGKFNFIQRGAALSPGKQYRLCFEVPDAVTQFAIEVGGDIGEPATFVVKSPDGKTVARADRQELRSVLRIDHPSGRGGIWTLEISGMKEDVLFRLSPELPGLVADSPGNLPRVLTAPVKP